MNGINIFWDTNPLIYLLDGKQPLSESDAEFLDGKQVWISVITELAELELFGKKNLNVNEIREINALLENCFVVDINSEIKSTTKKIMQESNVKLPDAIISSSAHYMGFPLFTSDKDFIQVTELDLILLEY